MKVCHRGGFGFTEYARETPQVREGRRKVNERDDAEVSQRTRHAYE
jgi:hypothetical protein